MYSIRSACGKLALFIAAIALCGFSQPPDKVPQSGATRTVSGTIGAMQRDTKQFVLKTADGREYIIAIDGRTALSTTGGNLNWFDLKQGMDATVTFAPSGNHFVAITVEASKGIPNPALGAAKQEPVAGAEPITLKGKVAKLRSDLSEVTITSFDDKDISLTIDDDLRTRIKNSDPTIPKLDKGVEVTAVYVVKNGRNQLVSLRDLVIKEQPSVAATPPANPLGANQSSRTTTVVNKPAMPATSAASSALPLVGLPLPTCFIATTNNPLGALSGQIVQVKQDMIFINATAQNGQTNTNPAGGQTNTGQAVPNPTSQATANPTNPIPPNPLAPGSNNIIAGPAGSNLFVILGVNSKQPFLVDQQTRITIGNRVVNLTDITEGSRIQVTFGLLADGNRHVTMINAMGAVNTSNPLNPHPQQPTGTSAPGQIPNVSTQNPNATGQSTTTAGQASNFAGIVMSRKLQSLIVRDANGKDLEFFMEVNSPEPLRVDDRTRIQINGQDGKLSDLQVGMQVNVFLEMVNNLRRVIGITVGNSTTNTSTGNNTGLTGGKK
jgi:hypothetical protein